MLRIGDAGNQLGKIFVSKTLQQLRSTRPFLSVLLQANLNVLHQICAWLKLLGQLMRKSKCFQCFHPFHGSVKFKEKLEHDDSQWVNIYLLVVFFAFQLLRSAVKPRSHCLCLIAQKIWLIWFQRYADWPLLCGGKSKIADFHFVLVGEEDVGRLEISVDDFFGVNVGKSF